MMKMLHLISYVLLTIYLIVMGHSMVPHHHHEQSFTDECSQEIINEHQHGHAELCADSSCNNESEEQTPCHFEVRPVPGKSLAIGTYAVLTAILRQLYIPEKEDCVWPESTLAHIQDPCLDVYALRAPPSLV